MVRMVEQPVRSHRGFAHEHGAAYREMFPRLTRHGVFLPNAHFGLLSTAHTPADLDAVVAAHAAVFDELKQAGHFDA